MEAVFLVVGALALAVLLLSLVAGEIGDLGDADGPFSVPAVAALLGGVGFGGAAAATLLPETLPDAGRALLACSPGCSSPPRWPGPWADRSGAGGAPERDT